MRYGSSDAEAFLADSPLLDGPDDGPDAAVPPVSKRTGLWTAVMVTCLLVLGFVGVAQRGNVGALLRGTSSAPAMNPKTTLLTTSSSKASSSSSSSSPKAAASKGGLMISGNPNPSGGLMTSSNEGTEAADEIESSSSSSASSSTEVLPGSPNDPAIAEKRLKIEAAKAVIAGTATPEQIALAGVDYEAIVSEAEGALAPLASKTRCALCV